MKSIQDHEWKRLFKHAREKRRATPTCGIAILFRHSNRDRIPTGERGIQAAITPQGLTRARQVGGWLNLKPSWCVSSPMLRCQQTASAFLSGASDGAGVLIRETSLLGNPGPYVAAPDQAWDDFHTLGKFELVRQLIRGNRGAPVFTPLNIGTRALLGALFAPPLSDCAGAPPLIIGFSHDIIMSLFLSFVRGDTIQDHEWPRFLESILIVETSDEYEVYYRNQRDVLSKGRLT